MSKKISTKLFELFYEVTIHFGWLQEKQRTCSLADPIMFKDTFKPTSVFLCVIVRIIVIKSYSGVIIYAHVVRNIVCILHLGSLIVPFFIVNRVTA